MTKKEIGKKITFLMMVLSLAYYDYKYERWYIK